MGILLSFTPWILYWIIAGNNAFREAIIAAAISAVIINIRQIWRRKIKVLDMGTLSFYAIMVVVSFIIEPARLEYWTQILGNGALTIIALVSIIIGRPFTIQYARETVPQEYWDTPGFKYVNLIITIVWTSSFFIQTLSSSVTLFWPRHELWFSWIIPMSCFALCIKFTAWYPEYVQRKTEAAEAQT